MSSLDVYRAKRDFTRTREPQGGKARRKAGERGGVFVVHKHAARRLHYDLRLEHNGVLWSWAVTRGPSLDPEEKRLAVHVEDHPLDYGSFEGTIPAGQYGAGSVIVWDEGRWLPEGDPAAGIKKGHLVFALEGHKLAGRWHLVRLRPRRGEKRDNWLLIKSDDAAARSDEDILETAPNSVKSGLSIEEVGRGEARGSAKARRKPAAGAMPAGASKPAGAAEAMPAFVEPCLATLQARPPEGEAWLHEVKFDGYRLQARVLDGTVNLLTRSGLDWTDRFGRNLIDALAALPCEAALIDGEVVALSETGSSFSALQAALSDGKVDELVFYAFDLIHLDGEDLRDDPLIARKERLEALLQRVPEDGPLRFSEHFVEPGEAMLRHACRIGLEGVVSKRRDAPYRSGRGRDWIKSKCTQRQEFVIAGYVPSTASGRSLRSLVMGYYEDGRLKPAGGVGTGFTQKSAKILKAQLDRLATETSPFSGAAARQRGVVWVKPELVAEIEFRAWTASRTLRHASFLGLREDKPAKQVRGEWPVDGKESGSAGKRSADRKGASPPMAKTTVKLSNPGKALWPETGLTKQGLLDYYAHVWPVMKRFVLERPLSLVRAPDGIQDQTFFQKHASPGMHQAIASQRDSDGEELLFIRDFDGLAALVQLGTVEIHAWGAPLAAIETPDQIIFDMDPDKGIALQELRSATLAVRERLDQLGFTSFLKTSGGKGFHVVVPLQPKADWAQVKAFSRDFAKAMEQAEPKRFTATLSKKARKGRIFIDYLRNGRGATAIVPYSTRARPGAAVAMPIPWDAITEVEPDGFRAMDLVGGAVDEVWTDFSRQARPLRMG
ncbi:DNA ligase D [Bosea sp. CS1GBMeth4]|uniref:DNA ligase D n=1 Tax=Bosea sp. CS1GBMeth4 TaxID=1892849 RepID=UPI001647C90D|nr:DNA ligase D [Bosea sp. CS1GBMeth4]